MITNINNIQNPTDYSYLTTYVDKYLIQALANLGQRIGIKGDGIEYKNFTFYDLFTESSAVSKYTYTASKYIGVIQYRNNDDATVANIGIIEKGKRCTGASSIIADTLVTDKNVFNTQTTSSIINDIIVNNTKAYLPGSIIRVHDGYMYTLMFAQIFGTDDSDTNNLEIQYNKFNIDTGKLEYAIRMSYCHTIDKKSWYVMHVLDENTKRNETNHVQMYSTLKTYTFSTAILDEYMRGDFEKLFTSSQFKTSAYYISSLTDNDIADPLYYIDMFNVVASLNGASQDIYTSPYCTNLIYDSAKDVRYSFESIYNDTTTIANEWLKEMNAADIQTIVQYLNNDMSYSFKNILTQYSNKQYNETQSTLTRHILFALYEQLCKNDTSNGTCTMYIPLDYKFNTIQSDSNALKLYYSNELYVTLTNLDVYNDEERIVFFDNNSNIVFDYTGLETVHIYNFNINYNNIYNDLVNSINVRYLYALPYISASNTWIVNNTDTNISAVGKNAGNPTIIINYNTGTTYRVLNASNSEILDGVTWEPRQYKLIVGDEEVSSTVYVPEPSVQEAYKFKYALILNIDATSSHTYTTLWDMSNTLQPDGQYKNVFEYIEDPENVGYALDFNKILNIEHIVEKVTSSSGMSTAPIKCTYYVANDDSTANTFDTYSSNYFTIRNKIGSEYIGDFVSDRYDNNLNLDIHYNTDLEYTNGQYVISQDDTRYMDALLETNLDPIANPSAVTNHPYPEIVTVCETYETSYTNVRIERDVINMGESFSNIVSVWNDDDTENEEATMYVNTVLSEYVKGISTHTAITFKLVEYTTTTSIEIRYGKLYNYNFSNEWVPNINVPNMDLSEMLVRNVNVLNRMNVISLDKNGKVYNAYIGTSFDEGDNKQVLRIGTNETNINMGLNTLVSSRNAVNFRKHTMLSIDMDTRINGKFITSSAVDETRDNSTTIYTASIRPCGQVAPQSIGAYIDAVTMQAYVTYCNDVFDSYMFVNVNSYVTATKSTADMQNAYLDTVFDQSAMTYNDHTDYVMNSPTMDLKTVNTTWRDYTFNDIRVIEQDMNGQFVERSASDSQYVSIDGTRITAKRDGTVRFIMFKNSYIGNDAYTHVVNDIYIDNETERVFNAYDKYKRYSVDVVIKCGNHIATLLNLTKMFNDKFNVQFDNIVSDDRIIQLKSDKNYYMILNEYENESTIKSLPNSICSIYDDYLDIWWELNGTTLYVGIKNVNDNVRNLYRNLIINEQ